MNWSRTILLLLAATASAEVCVWPPELTLPDTAATDTVRTLSYQTEKQYYPGSVVSNERLRFTHEDSSLSISQLANYQASYDFGPGTTTKSRYGDLSGKSLWKTKTLMNYAGLDWTPTFILRRNESNVQALQGNVDAGPAAGFLLGTVPLQVRGGVAARGWYDSIPDQLQSLKESSGHGKPGLYGNLILGDKKRLFAGLPLYATGSLYGRTPAGARLFTADGSLLTGNSFASGDSFFLYCAESFRGGRGLSLSEDSAGRLRTENTEPALRQDFSLLSAVKGTPRYGIVPALVYGFAGRSDQPGSLRDVKDRTSSFKIMGWSDSLFGVHYLGGIGFVWNSEDHLFGKTVQDSLDSILADIQDMRTLSVSMTHHLFRYLDNGMGIEYSFNDSVFRLDYPTEHPASRNPDSTIRNSGAKDEASRVHQLSLSVLPFKRFTTNLTGEYRENILNLLKSENSARNYTMYQYKVGATLGAQPFAALAVTGDFSAAARRQSFQYPEFHRGTGTFPGYWRDFIAVLSAEWKIREKWKMSAQGSAQYHDEGDWYGKEYRDSLDAYFHDREYYGIASKYRDYHSMISSSVQLFDMVTLELGCQERNVRNGSYETYDSHYNYTIIPFLNCKSAFLKHYSVAASIRRRFSTMDQNSWDMRGAALVLF
jgi:hypothetical protein